MGKIYKTLIYDGQISLSVLDTTDVVNKAIELHGLTPLCAAGLGRALTVASFMATSLKDENEKLSVTIDGNGVGGKIVVCADGNLNVRGSIVNPHADLPLKPNGKLDVGGAVGRDGMITVSRDIGLREPYIGSTQLISGEIAEDLTAYMLESEQIPSACGLGVLIDTDLSVKSAGGFIVQLMPGAPEEYIDLLEENIFMMDQLTTVLAEDGLEAVFDQVLKGLEHHMVGEDEIGYRCYCSRDRVGQALLGAGRDELKNMIAEGKPVEVSCQFCDTVYSFSPEDMKALLEEAESD